MKMQMSRKKSDVSRLNRIFCDKLFGWRMKNDAERERKTRKEKCLRKKS